MKIVKIELYEVVLPMKKSFEVGFGVIKSKRELIIRLHTAEGLIGYGESPSLQEPTYTHETTESCKQTITKHLAPRIIGKTFETVNQFRYSYNDIVGNNIAKSGVEAAFWHLLAQRDNQSLKTLMGGTKSKVLVGESVGIMPSITEFMSTSEEYVTRGFARLKVKIKPGWDIEPLDSLRNRWPNIPISVDANASYNFKDHKKILKQLDSFDLEMIEQPFGADNFIDHARLQDMLSTPICLDESIESLNNAITAIEASSCRVINIKPPRVGGLSESIAIHNYAATKNIGVWCGGMLETGIGRAFNLALASLANFKYPADMSPSDIYYEDDLITPALRLEKDGTMLVPDKPGLGYTVNQQKVERYSIKYHVVT